MTEVRLRPEAEQDLAEAAVWYEQQRVGLGDQFLDEALTTFDKVGELPQLYPSVHKDTRRALMRRFPFGVFYQLDDIGAVVIAIMHVRRHPQRWKSRA